MFNTFDMYIQWFVLKGMTFDHDFGFSFPNFSSLLKKRGKRFKENEVTKIVIKFMHFCSIHTMKIKCFK